MGADAVERVGRRRLSRVAAALAALLLAGVACAVERVTVLALFADRAVIRVDGTQYTLAPGERSPEGVELISADSEGAVLVVDGERRRYAIGRHIGGSFAAPQGTEVHIWPDNTGMYRTAGSINGMPLTLLVDTGATLVTLNAGQARRLGIDYRLQGREGAVETASGYARAFEVTLDRVQVGELIVRSVPAVVLDGPQPSQVLLGMSFLGRVGMSREKGALVLGSQL